MRERELRVVFTFHTTAAAMAMEKRCRQLSLPGRLIPVPRALTSDCGIAWSAPAAERETLASAPGMPEFAGVHELLL